MIKYRPTAGLAQALGIKVENGEPNQDGLGGIVLEKQPPSIANWG